MTTRKTDVKPDSPPRKPWAEPRISVIAAGMEINAYACPERKQR